MQDAKAKVKSLEKVYSDVISGDEPTKTEESKAIPIVTTKAQYDSLPKGAIYIENNKQYRKP